ncbi:uridine kinase family protein [Aeromicrobium sp.]|uniref:uridine kinase family protein n=1 Tax=Aeromicrobium sp. TaxID=1871063 RepID=UPI003D6BCDDC
MTDVEEIVAAIKLLRDELGRVVVGVSGYAGAGKSTLAHRVLDAVDDSVRLRGDDFLDPRRSHQRSDDWDGVERHRLRTEVLEPFRAGRPAVFRPLDWSTRQLGEPTPLPQASVLVVDAVGLLHPELLPCLDLTVWIVVDLEVAQARGMARDRAAGRDHDRLWTEVWTPNDRQFEHMFAPSAQADIRYTPDDEP